MLAKIFSKFPKLLSAYVWFGSILIGWMLYPLKKVMEHFVSLKGFKISPAISAKLESILNNATIKDLSKDLRTLYRSGGIGLINRDGSPHYTESVNRKPVPIPTFDWTDSAAFTTKMTRVQSIAAKMVAKGLTSGDEVRLNHQMDEMMEWTDEALDAVERMAEGWNAFLNYGEPS